MDTLKPLLHDYTRKVDVHLQAYQPHQIVLATLATVLAWHFVTSFVNALQRYGVKGLAMLVVLRFVAFVPGGKGKIAEENEKMRKKMEASVLKENDPVRHTKLPEEGLPEQEIFGFLNKWKEAEDKHWKNGRVSGAIYHGGDKLKELNNRAYNLFSIANPLHPDLFPFVRKMEAEIVRMSCSLFNGGPETCGTMTSGGTESILMAMKCYRDEARTRGIRHPEIVACVSAHAAFDKAAHYFDMKLVHVPMDLTTYRVDVRAVEKAITRNTVVIIGSAYPFPQGCMDPIQELAKLARKYKVGLHVDACLGGFVLPYLPELGYNVPAWDFRVPEVTSISADPHKYAFAPKGCSVVLYRSPALRTFQYFVATDWVGGIYGSPSVAGSRPGGLIAGCWATMMYMGRQGYLKVVKDIMTTTDAIKAGIRRMDGIKLCGEPEGSVIAFESADPALDIYKVGEAMTNRKWHLNTLQFPRSIHLCVTNMQVGQADVFLKELKDSLAEVRANPKAFKDGSAAIYGMAESIPDRSMVETMARQFIDALYTV